MTATKAVSCLFDSVVQLLTGTVDLVCKAVGLLTALAMYATSALQKRTTSTKPKTLGDVMDREEKKRNASRLVAEALPAIEETERLTTALIGLGFQTPAVRRYVASVKTRVGHEPIETLIKEGLRALAS